MSKTTKKEIFLLFGKDIAVDNREHVDRAVAAGNKVRHYYQCSDVKKGNYQQITDTGHGFEVYFKAPVHAKPKKFVIDYSEASAFVAMLKIIDMRQDSSHSACDYYKIFQEKK